MCKTLNKIYWQFSSKIVKESVWSDHNTISGLLVRSLIVEHFKSRENSSPIDENHINAKHVLVSWYYRFTRREVVLDQDVIILIDINWGSQVRNSNSKLAPCPKRQQKPCWKSLHFNRLTQRFSSQINVCQHFIILCDFKQC